MHDLLPFLVGFLAVTLPGPLARAARSFHDEWQRKRAVDAALRDTRR